MPRRTATSLTKRTIDQAKPGTTLWDRELPGFGIRTTPAGTKSFIYQYRMLNQRQGKTTIGGFPGLTVDQARKLAREYAAMVERGESPSDVKRSIRTAATVRDLAERYCGSYAITNNLKPTVVRDARSLLNRYVLPSLGTRKAAEVRSSEIEAVVGNARQNIGKSQANKLIAVLKKMFNLAIDDDAALVNPVRVKKTAEDQRYRFLSHVEVCGLLNACDQYADQHAADAVRLLLFTGARLQEVLKAEWCQFDLVKGVWLKPSAHTKTKRQHRLMLPSNVVALLITMRARDPVTPFLFPGRSGTKPRADLKRPWTDIVTMAGLKDVRKHDLRRTTATFMASTGADLHTVGKALGHTQVSTTARYAWIFDERQAEGLSRAVGAMIDGMGSHHSAS